MRTEGWKPALAAGAAVACFCVGVLSGEAAGQTPKAEQSQSSVQQAIDYTADHGTSHASDSNRAKHTPPRGTASSMYRQPGVYPPYMYPPYMQSRAYPYWRAPPARFAPYGVPRYKMAAVPNGGPSIMTPGSVPRTTPGPSLDGASTDGAVIASDGEGASGGEGYECVASDDCDCGPCDDYRHRWLPIITVNECCPLVCEEEEVWRALGHCCRLQNQGLSIFGWVDGGVVGTDRAPADRFNGPVTFPDRNGEGQLNQAYFVMERAVPEENYGAFLGGRVDFLYGSDYFFTTAAGFDGTSFGNVPRWGNNNFLYGAAMPQLYVEAAYNDLTVKLGHFYTIIGYEVVPAIGNFFYTHAYTMQYGEPFTHTGVLASRPLGEDWTVYAGVTNGWDSFNTDTRANFLGGLTYATDDWGSLAFAINTGGESINGPGVGPWANRTMYSLVWSRNLTSRLTYVLQHDYGNQDLGPIDEQNAEWYGINQYVFYKLNCCWTAGVRIEWFRDDDGYRVTGLRPGNAIAGASFPGNFYECTLGLNWKPNANFIVRPEIRWDWYAGNSPTPGITGPFNAGTADNQFLYGLDAIYQW